MIIWHNMIALLDYQNTRIALALLDDKKLVELRFFAANEEAPGQFYRGIVRKVDHSLHAAFVDIGGERCAFLPDADDLKQEETILVQSEAVQTTNTKGLRVTRAFSLTGKAFVLLPGKEGIFLSKKIHGIEQQMRLKSIGEKLCPEGFGLIMRTSWLSDPGDYLNDLDELMSTWDSIRTEFFQKQIPEQIAVSESALKQTLRKLEPSLSEVHYYFNKESEIKTFFSKNTTVRFIPETDFLYWDRWSIDAQAQRALCTTHYLPGGGSVIVNYCEAFTIYDVNSGKDDRHISGDDKIMAINLEAVSAVLEHIRLCNIGGMILVDLIDFQDKSRYPYLLHQIRQLAIMDSQSVNVLDITKLGILELTRKRSGITLRKALLRSCPICKGSGEIYSPEETARRIKNDISRKRISGQKGVLHVFCHNDVKPFLYDIEDIEVHTKKSVYSTYYIEQFLNAHKED